MMTPCTREDLLRPEGQVAAMQSVIISVSRLCAPLSLLPNAREKYRTYNPLKRYVLAPSALWFFGQFENQPDSGTTPSCQGKRGGNFGPRLNHDEAAP